MPGLSVPPGFFLVMPTTRACAWHWGLTLRATGTGSPHFFTVDPVLALLRRSGGEVDWNSHPWSTDPSSSPQSWVELTSASLGSSPGFYEFHEAPCVSTVVD